jgi:hypothetical protein
MLHAFFEAYGVVSTALLAGLRAIGKKTSNTRRGIGCLPFGGRWSEQRMYQENRRQNTEQQPTGKQDRETDHRPKRTPMEVATIFSRKRDQGQS